MQKLEVKGIVEPPSVSSGTGDEQQDGGSAQSSAKRRPPAALALDLEMDPVDLGPKIAEGLFKQMADTSQRDSWKQRKKGLDALQRILDESKMVRILLQTPERMAYSSQ